MGMFLRAFGAIMIAVILSLTLSKQEKELSLLLTIGVCCMVILVALEYLSPMVDFIHRLEVLCDGEKGWIGILLKAVGIGLVAEIAALVCTDAGNGSLGKSLQFLASAVIIYLSIPVFNGLMDLLQQILGEV